MTWLAAWRAVKLVPAWVYLATLLAGVVGTHLVTDQRRVDVAYRRGHAAALDGAHFDSVMVTRIADARRAAVAQTDTIWRTVTKHVRRVDSIHVPDTVRVRYPVVDTLVVESRALVVAVDSLTRTLTTERNATVLLVTTLQQSVQDARLVTARLDAQNAALRKRPTRLHALGYVVASAGVAYMVAR